MTDSGHGGNNISAPLSRRLIRLGLALNRHWKRILQVLIGVSALALFLRWIDVRESLYVLRGMAPWPVVGTVLLGVVGTTLRGVRFYALARGVGAPVEMAQSVLANYAASLPAIVTPARAGEGAKVLFFPHRKRLAACFALEKLADVTLLLLAGAYGALVFRQYISVLAILAGLLVLGVVALLNLERLLHLVMRSGSLDDGWLWATTRQIPGRIWVVFLLCSLTIWFLGVLAQVAGARSLGLRIPIRSMVQVSALSAIAGILSGTPSGIGTSQFVFTSLLTGILDVDRAVIGTLSLLLLVAAYVTAIVQGTVGLVLYRTLARWWDGH